jgi:hypothetical protein
MTSPKSRDWTRRKLMSVAPAVLAPAILPETVRALLAQVGAPSEPFSKFTDVAHSAGLTETMFYGETENVKYIIESVGGGCAFFDYDNDGWMDIFIVGGRRLAGVPPGASNRLYHNNRDGTFKDVTAKAGLTDAGWANGVCVGDYNNDGFEDLFITYYGQNKLYRNNGNGTFTEVTKQAGLLHPNTRFSTGCTFLDYNRNGSLDLFVANYVEFDMSHAPLPSLEVPNCNFEGVAVFCGPRGLPAPQHYLYRNNGDGTFTDVSKESGIAAVRGSYGLTAVATDVDEDGWPDIFLACDATPSLLLMNNHDGTFREEGLLRGIAVGSEGQNLGGMGIGPGDYDLDGHVDYVKTHFQDQSTGLYRNDGKGNFEDVSMKAGLGSETRFVSWGVGMVDLDNDGNPDIFIANGNVNPELERVHAKYPWRNPRLVYRNQGNGRFAELGADAGAAIAARYVSRGCAFGDFDNDGDMDIVIMNLNEPPSLLRNDAPGKNHWIKIRLEGTHSNRSAIGSRVVVQYGGKMQAQEVMSQCSYLSSNDPRLHFGLGSVATVDIQVRWPDGKSETYPKVSANQLVTVREGQGIVKGRPFR